MSSTANEYGEPFDLALMELLRMPDRSGLWNQPLTADELLGIGHQVFEPLFHEPPIGPIPEYLAPHMSVHGCVAEYEDKIEELDRWKTRELDRWLKTRIGKHWSVSGRTYQLLAEEDIDGIPHQYRFTLIDEPNLFSTLTNNQS